MNRKLSLKKRRLSKKVPHILPEGMARERADGKGSAAFWDRVGRIEGLCLSTGLERVEGQQDVYEKMLRLMIPEIEKSNKNLQEFLFLRDMRGFSIEVHGIKGSLATIGAPELAEKAHDLEIAADRLDIAFCESGLSDFLAKLNTLHQELNEAFSILKPAYSASRAEIPSELPGIMESLIEALHETDIVAIAYETERMGTLPLGGIQKEQAGQIADYVMMMAYPEAADLTQKMLREVSAILQDRC